MAELGSRLLVGRGVAPAPQEGIAWLHKAGELGDGEALAVFATLVGVGAWMPQDWDKSFDYLQQAAERGSTRAQTQLLLLAQPTDTPSHGVPGMWAQMRAAIDRTSWANPPRRQPLLEAPRIRLVKDFVSPAVCDWIIDRARGRLQRATMYSGTTKRTEFDPTRTCSDYQFDIVNTDVVLLMLRERIAAATGIPTPMMEPPRVFHYAEGEEIKPHYDRLVDGTEGYGGPGGYQGDRVVTFLLYLNDEYDGGELDFPRANFRAKGAKGDAIYFAHVDQFNKQEKLSLHAGLKINRGEKWILSQWIHDRPFRA